MDSAAEPPIIYLMGPTAAGKTALAMRLRARLPVELISVDSAMVYRGLDIGTAKPSPAEQAAAPHRLIDTCEPTENYSVGRFCRDARAAIKTIRHAGKIPLLVGGTGLYFRLLEQGVSRLPAGDAGVRAALAAWMRAQGVRQAHARLAAIDPAAAGRIHAHDRQRIQRALEVYEITGKPLSAWQADGRRGALPLRPLKFILAPAERAALHRRVARRFEQMLARGLLDEVDTFYRRADMHAGLSAMRLVGYRQAWRYLAGGLSYQDMREHAIIATRQLVKRQFTWLRAEGDAEWLAPGRVEQAVDHILSVVDKAAPQ